MEREGARADLIIDCGADNKGWVAGGCRPDQTGLFPAGHRTLQTVLDKQPPVLVSSRQNRFKRRPPTDM